MVARVGHGAELAANIVDNPRYGVGLAASKTDLSVGLAASFGELTEYIWIWLVGVIGGWGATAVCAWV